MEVTVKLMKKILCAVWNGRYLDGDKLCKGSCLVMGGQTAFGLEIIHLAMKGYYDIVKILAHPNSFDLW